MLYAAQFGQLQYGQLDCLKYAHQHDCPCNHEECINTLNNIEKDELCKLCRNMIYINNEVGKVCSKCQTPFHKECLKVMVNHRFDCPKCQEHVLWFLKKIDL